MKALRTTLIAIAIATLAHGGAVALTVGQEREIGGRVAAHILSSSSAIEDFQVQRYIQTLGDKLVKASGPSLFKYHFFILSDPDVNAFALPGGYIFFNSGLISTVQSEDELAAVMAHEIAHVRNRHISRQIEKMQLVNLGTIAALLAAIFAGPDVQSSTAMGAAAIAAGQAAQLSYSREQEEEADRTGALTMLKAGFDPAAMAIFFERLAKSAPEDMLPPYLSTHPALDVRINKIKSIAAAHKDEIKPRRDSQQDFLKIKLRIEVADGDARALIKKYKNLIEENENVEYTNCYKLALALAYKRSGQLKKAEEVFIRAEKDGIRDANFMREWGKLLFEQGDFARAREKFDEARKLDPADPENIFFTGLIEEEQSNPRAAVALFKKVLRLQPDWNQALYHLGLNYGRINNQCRGYYYLGLYEESYGHWNAAYRHYKEAIEACRTNPKLVKNIKERMERIIEIVGASK